MKNTSGGVGHNFFDDFTSFYQWKVYNFFAQKISGGGYTLRNFWQGGIPLVPLPSTTYNPIINCGFSQQEFVLQFNFNSSKYQAGTDFFVPLSLDLPTNSAQSLHLVEDGFHSVDDDV